jgi:hypothetical protein
MFCQYKNIFGKPYQGLHALRIKHFALIDILLTIILALIIAYLTNYSVFLILIFLLILGEFLHIIFCVDTAFIKMLKSI